MHSKAQCHSGNNILTTFQECLCSRIIYLSRPLLLNVHRWLPSSEITSTRPPYPATAAIWTARVAIMSTLCRTKIQGEHYREVQMRISRKIGTYPRWMVGDGECRLRSTFYLRKNGPIYCETGEHRFSTNCQNLKGCKQNERGKPQLECFLDRRKVRVIIDAMHLR